MTATTLAQQLTNVRAAIEKIETTVQSITSPDGRTTAFARLETLYKREISLINRIARSSGDDRRVCEM